ncbi:MAG: ClC family H(+)/Cl(-) exchange transporter [Thermotoga caldifontis]|uniref:ClC family H(+)/Cl(-) exchange transporter n=1 Tax=Thermotoga caldifontis TaxID=1508419 RepID=UPI003C79E394
MDQRSNFLYALLRSALMGSVAGVIVALYRLCIVKVDNVRTLLALNHSFLLWVILSIFIALILEVVVRRLPFISGSGIPQVRALIAKKMDYDPLKVLTGKFVGGILAIFNGLSLGREGPSIHIGSTVGHWFYNKFGGLDSQREQFITVSACAGLAAAFNAPLAAIAFSVEELQRSFSLQNALNCAVAVVSADLVSKLFFGTGPVFSIHLEGVLPVKYYGLVVLLGTLLGVSGWLFERSLLWFVDIFKKIKRFHILIPTALAWFFMLSLPQVLGGGHELVDSVSAGLFSLRTILNLLICKLFFTLISYGSRAPGGIFLPMVAIGAMIGSLYHRAITSVGIVDVLYLPNFAILGIAGFLTAVVRAPLTSVVLTAELVGSFGHFMTLLLVSIVAYIASGFLETKPVYDELLKRVSQSTHPYAGSQEAELSAEKESEDTDLA